VHHPPGNVLQSLSLNPKALAGLEIFQAAFEANCTLTPHQCEMIAVVTFTVQMAEDWRSADLSEKEFGMLEYVEKIAVTAPSIVSDDADHLRELGWND